VSRGHAVEDISPAKNPVKYPRFGLFSMPMIKKQLVEIKTARVMIEMYCKHHHGSGGLCGECASLLEYVSRRINKCPHGEEKPACSKCEVHCYKLNMRNKIKEVMRFAGPKMTWRHPVLALRHIVTKS